MSTKRMTANPSQPSRHRPNKVVAEQDSSDFESSEEDTSQPSKPPPKITSASGITTNLSKLDVSERRKIAAAKEQARLEEEKLLKAKAEEGFETASEEESEDESSGEDESSEEEESEEEVPRRVMMRPTFIKKDKRNNAAAPIDTRTEEELAAAKEAERVAKADSLLEDAFAEARSAKEKHKEKYQYRNEREDLDDVEVDTDDEVEPEVAQALWKLREIKRFKRERETIEEREKEIVELERRRGLTEEERKLEDDKHIALQKEEREGKDKMGFMQKYFHKGAFYADDAKAQGLDRREIMGAKFADDVDRELLPKALQMRDMTKIGKRGATKYKDLKSEDTGNWGQFDDRGSRKGGSQGFGQDERFMPDRNRGGVAGASGANSMPVAERRKEINAPEGPKAMRLRAEDDTYRPSDRDDRDRSRSRSPRRERDQYHHRRKRSISRDRSYRDSDKRRRVEER